MRKFWVVFIVVCVCVLGGLGLLYRAMQGLETEGPVATGGGVLEWRVDAEFAEEPADSPLTLVLEGRRPVMRDLVFALGRAARDERITGMLLDIRQLPVDWAKVEELRDAVAAFAAGGKPVVAYVESGGDKEYALALGASHVVMPPEGNLFVLGVSAELTFLKDTLDKLGMRADFVHVGRYKSAPEMLTRSGPSEANREMIESVVDSQYERLVDLIAAGRHVDTEAARVWIDTGLYDAQGALAAGLVDTVASLDGAKEHWFPDQESVPFEDYLRGPRRGRAAATVALVHISGTITGGESHDDDWTGPMTGSDTVVERLEKAREDRGVRAVILRVDSPGGSALASDLIWQEVARVRKEKPVLVSMSGYAASGGYYISCGADSIFAEPGTLTGSIGVFAGKVDIRGFYEKIGVQREYISRGENALLFSNDDVFTEPQRAALQAQLGRFYDRFVAKVAEGRRLTPEAVAAIAEGRVWTGAQAREHGLVDGLGGLQRTLTAAKRLLGVPESGLVAVQTYEEPLTFLERMLASSIRRRTTGVRAALPLLPAASALRRDGVIAAASLLDGRPLALLPLRIDLH